MKYKQSNMKEHIQFINSAGFLDSASFSESDNADFTEKRALVLVEGVHKDSAKRIHKFDAARIQEIVNNTNEFLAQGGRIPWQRDHKKEQEFNVGDLESPLQVRVITESDLPNPRLRHLVGKVGIFADKLVAKGRKNVEAVLSKSISTLSPGIDIVNNVIKEISATPTPAIVGPSTFSRYNSESANFALTMEEAEMEDADMDAQKEEFDALCDRFWNVMMNIQSATEEELQGEDPYSLSQQALESFEDRIYGIFGLTDEDDPASMQSNNPNSMMQGQRMPNYVRNQQEIRPTVGSRAGFTSSAFSMAEVEQANFAYSAGNPVANGQQRRKRSMLGTATKVGVGAAALGGAVRYGGAGVRGLRSAAALRNRTGQVIGKRAAVLGSVRKAASRDFARGTRQVRKGLNAVNSFITARRAAKGAAGALARI